MKNPTFQHRHYKEIARIVATTNSRKELIDALASYFIRDNDRFDYARFEAACLGKPLMKKDAA